VPQIGVSRERIRRMSEDQRPQSQTTNSDDELVAVPRWVLDVLSEELAGHTMCGGPVTKMAARDAMPSELPRRL